VKIILNSRCKTETVAIQCKEEASQQAESNEYCGLAKDPSQAFGECIQSGKVDVDNFYTSCKMDVCAYWDVPDARQTVACTALESLAEQCAQLGYRASWRNEKFCR